MIEVHISNQFNVLIKNACNILTKNPLKNPLAKEIFIIDNKKISQWLQIMISNNLEISANIKFYTPYTFISKIINYVLPNEKHLNEHDNLFWKIMSLHELKKINNTLINPNSSSTKKLHFASYFSKLFHKYLIHRPNWIIDWEKNIEKKPSLSEDICQKNLWNLIIKHNKKLKLSKWNFSSILQKILKATNDLKKINLFAPRIVICGMYDIHYSYFLILSKISKFCKVIILLNSSYSLHDYNSIKNIYNNNLLSTNNLTDFNDSFIKNISQFDYTNLMILQSIKVKKIFYSYTNKQSNLLEKIQFDIINNKQINNNFLKTTNKNFFFPNDRSIQIHICHNFKHEIEILHNNLFVLLQKNPAIKPIDILVVSQNIDIYTSFIHEIFNTDEEKLYIPYRIHNTNLYNTDSFFTFFDTLLSLPENLFTIDEIFSYIRLPFINKKIYFSENELLTLKKWITHTNIKWGFNEQHFKEISISCNKYNSWKYGIQRIFLGYSIGQKNKIWNKILSSNTPNSSTIEIIGKIYNFVSLLNKWRKILKSSRTLKNWLPLCNNLISDFFCPQKTTNKNKIFIIQKTWMKFINLGIKNNYKKKFL